MKLGEEYLSRLNELRCIEGHSRLQLMLSLNALSLAIGGSRMNFGDLIFTVKELCCYTDQL